MHHHRRMPWQDVVISLANASAAIALWPSIRSDDKPAKRTSAMTVCALLASATALLSLKLWFSGAIMLVMCGMWATLLIQVIRRDRSVQEELQSVSELQPTPARAQAPDERVFL